MRAGGVADRDDERVRRETQRILTACMESETDRHLPRLPGS